MELGDGVLRLTSAPRSRTGSPTATWSGPWSGRARPGRLGTAVVDVPHEVAIEEVEQVLQPGRRDGLADDDVGVDAGPAD